MKVYVLLMVVAGALTVLLTPLVRWACLRWGIVPKLRSRDIQSTPIPRLGGIAITIALVITMLISARRFDGFQWRAIGKFPNFWCHNWLLTPLLDADRFPHRRNHECGQLH